MTEETITSAGKRAVKTQPSGAEANPKRTRPTSRRLIVASNRVAVDADRHDLGGLAVALRAALENAGGVWFGWSGKVAEDPQRAN